MHFFRSIRVAGAIRSGDKAVSLPSALAEAEAEAETVCPALDGTEKREISGACDHR